MSLCDWPGRAVTVLYTGGCNLRCPCCHNASLAWTPEAHPELNLEKVLTVIKARKPWLDGVVICGGEPTLDPGLPWLAEKISGLGLPVKVDTNGTRPEVVAELAERLPELVFAVDIKGPWDKYPELTGQTLDARQAQESLEQILTLAASRPGSFLFRITLVPGLSREDIGVARGYLPSGAVLREQAYVPPKTRKDTHAPADREARRMPGDLVHQPHSPGHPQGPQG